MNIKTVACFIIMHAHAAQYQHVTLSSETLTHLCDEEMLEKVLVDDPKIIKKIMKSSYKKLPIFIEVHDDLCTPTVHETLLQQFANKQLKNRLLSLQKNLNKPKAAGGKSLAQTLCGHLFHKRCIKMQAAVNHKCPLCRCPLRRKKYTDYHYIVSTQKLNDTCAICLENL